MSYYDSFPRYERSARRPASDGIKARTTTFGKAWWSRLWIGALDAFGWSNRLQRGRSYARSGQVLDYTVKAGRVEARVQGSRRTPYAVTIALKALDAAAWEKVLDTLSSRAEYAARLLNGDMPTDIDEAFASAGARLLPSNEKDLVTECSCPDWANPCKHVAAVHYILAEALDTDPFILMSLRGRDRDDVLAGLRQRRGTEPVEEAVVPSDEPLAVEGFWKGRGDLSSLDMGLAPPRVRASVLRRLGTPGPWASDDEVLAVFGPVLAAGSEEALKAARDG